MRELSLSRNWCKLDTDVRNVSPSHRMCVRDTRLFMRYGSCHIKALSNVQTSVLLRIMCTRIVLYCHICILGVNHEGIVLELQLM
uniref:Uncharacterized protein n=1 Tax=Arundo donax TaxID=35708 RepID=A0A0A8Z391_ARUDO